MSELIVRYRRWFDYEQDVHTSVLSAFESVPEGRRRDSAYQGALDLFAHVLEARRLWLHRFGVTEEGPDDLFPESVELAALHEQARDVNALWRDWLSAAGDAEIAREFRYTAMEGDAYKNTVEDILTQLFVHSSYHRGQIARAIRELGGVPAVTDFVYWSREEIPG